MKKFAICFLALAAIALFVPASFAAPVTTCYHLTYFCDGVQGTGAQLSEDAGLWDWQCLGNGTGQISIGPHLKFGSYPLYPYNTGSAGGFAANFKFNNNTHLFNLYGTFDGVSVFYFQHNSPFTTSAGACNPLHSNAGLKPATIR